MLYLDYSREDGDWLPNEYGGRENLQAIGFLKQLNEQAHGQYPRHPHHRRGIDRLAERLAAHLPGRAGLQPEVEHGLDERHAAATCATSPIHRKYHHDELTFSLIYAFHENFVLPLSHDEVVHGKGSLLDQMPGDLWQKFANLRLLYSYLWTHPGKKLLFMGCDFGQWNEWNFDDSLQWHLLQWDIAPRPAEVRGRSERLLRREKALYEVDFDYHGFQWIDCHNHEDSTLSYIRAAKDPRDFLVVCCNFTPVPRYHHRLGVPEVAWYEEIFNSDSTLLQRQQHGQRPGRAGRAAGRATAGRPRSR